jgi:Na+/H+-dicarboxylate symporter
MKVLSISLVIAPVGIFCLISKTFVTQGLSSIIELAKYFFVVVFILILHLILVYLPIIRIIGKTKIINFFNGMKEALIFAFSTSSSSATIPVTLENLKKNLAVKDKIASFTVPLGATINMDGTAIMQGVATVFIANAYGFDLSIVDYLNIILTSTLASIGTAGVPGVGIIMLGMVLNQVGLPLEGIALIMGVDRFLDMLRTTVNVAGDSMVSIVINKSEKK